MQWNLDKNRPICPQLCEQICVRIAAGKLKPGERWRSVREVALEAGVNPNTVQKAFGVLEQQGLIYSVRGSGWYVGEQIITAQQTVEQLKKSKTEAFFEEMKLLGQTKEQVKKIIEEWNG